MGLSSQLLCLFIAVFSAGTLCAAYCTPAEVRQMFKCLAPHSQQFFDAFVWSGLVCNRSDITPPLCRSFGVIVSCINGLDVSRDNCWPNAAAEINPRLEIPCKVEDFFAVCTDDVSNIGEKSCGTVGLSLPFLTLHLTVVFGVMMLIGRG